MNVFLEASTSKLVNFILMKTQPKISKVKYTFLFILQNNVH